MIILRMSRDFSFRCWGGNADLVDRAIDSGVSENVVGSYLPTLLGDSADLELINQVTQSGTSVTFCMIFQACMMIRKILGTSSNPLLAREMGKVIKRLTGEDPISDGEGELCLQLQIFQILDDCNNGAIIDSALGFNQILETLANIPAVPLESSGIVPNKEEETILEDPEKDKGKARANSVVPNRRSLLEQGSAELNRLGAFLRVDDGNPGTSSQVAKR